MTDPYVLYIIGTIQTIVLALGGWTLLTLNKLQGRVIAIETILSASLVDDIKDLKENVREMESRISIIEKNCIRHNGDN